MDKISKYVNFIRSIPYFKDVRIEIRLHPKNMHDKNIKDAILKKELKTFNWNEVDTYPSFPVCDSLDTLTNKKQCFETTLANHISTQLAKETFVVTQDINDTIILEFLISEKGQLQIEKFTVDSLTIAELPNIQQIIENRNDRNLQKLI